MGHSNPNRDVYAPPSSRIAADIRGALRIRFWATCLVCAVAIVILVVLPLEWSTKSSWTVATLVVAFWLVPVIWVLLPDLRRLGLKDAVLLRFVEISIRYVVTTAFLSVVIFVFSMLAYTLVVIVRDPGILNDLVSPD